MTRIQVVMLSHNGAVRDHNEDTIGVGFVRSVGSSAEPMAVVVDVVDPVVCVVADGMGGMAAGEVASQHVVDQLCSDTWRLDGQGVVASALVQLNSELYDQMDHNPSLLGMGTTVAGLAFLRDQVVVFNVGDSRVFRVQDGYLRQLSIDDSPGAGRPGVPAAKETAVVTQALGGATERLRIDPHVSVEGVVPPERYLLCSDGLSDMVDLDTIEACLAIPDDLDVTRALFREAMAGGGRDNVSILLVRVLDGDDVR